MNWQDPEADIDRAEWQAQELGLAHSRQAVDGRPDDPLIERYRYIADRLARPAPMGLPHSFASDTSHLIATGQPELEIATRRYEQWMRLGLLAILGATAAGCCIVFGMRWLEAGPLLHALAGQVPGWLILVIACIGISALIPRKI
ncbi:MAG TPA: hypothetical protein VNZ27_10505 [Rhodanobacter sp.]|jgi:hypothetical protein|nr:hypothetical protein [Rhodanobacter sp.]